ncbi:MAG: hypothetical protein Q9M29_02670, partial [Mariprofundaceae bacterium]|nr:hypothetical protein [Mariprofundaceae bacterium]
MHAEKNQPCSMTGAERLQKKAGQGLRPRFVRICLIIGIAFLTGFAALDWNVGNHAIAIVDLLLLPVLLAALAYLYRSDHATGAARIALAGFFAWFLLLMPLDPLYVVWMPAFPLLAIFALGRKEGMNAAWMFAITMSAGSMITWWLGYSPLNSIHLLTSMAALFFITVIAFFYQNRIETYQQRIARQAAAEMHAEAERRRLNERLEHVRRMESV